MKIISALASIVFTFSANAGVIQDFESGNLDGWIVSGRQTGGSTNVYGVSEYAGSKMGYLYHRGFSELVLSRSFSYLDDMVLSFDAEFSIDGDTSPTPSGGSEWTSYNVMYDVALLDISGNLLGARRYVAETTYWYTNFHNESGIIDSVFFPSGLQHYEYDISSFATGLGVNTSDIGSVYLNFIGYSPIAPSTSWFYQDWHTMIIRFDNVAISSNGSVISLPSSTLLLGSGLIGLLAFNRRRNEKTNMYLRV